jgi:hypothetical protein
MSIDYSYITSDSVRQAELMRPVVQQSAACYFLFTIKSIYYDVDNKNR